MALNIHILIHFDIIFLVIELFRQLIICINMKTRLVDLVLIFIKMSEESKSHNFAGAKNAQTFHDDIFCSAW